MKNKITTQRDYLDPVFIKLATEFDGKVILHRKQWEIISCYQTMLENNMLRPGRTGLGFSIGKERLPSLFAGYGCNILATDAPTTVKSSEQWKRTNQHCSQREELFYHQHISKEDFDNRVTFREVDANCIPQDLQNKFDFLWSICAFEHFGSIAAGIKFVVESSRCLKPGGVAFHTTEYNVSSNTDTQDHADSVFFRRKDLVGLTHILRSEGFLCEDIDFSTGDMQYDLDVFVSKKDTWPEHPHLKVKFDNYTVTCVRITVHKL